MKNWKYADFNKIVCFCSNINKKTIVDAIENGNNTLEKLKEVTGACTGNKCSELNPTGKCCSKDIMDLVRIYSPEQDTHQHSCGCC